jgi:hypothetical protein
VKDYVKTFSPIASTTSDDLGPMLRSPKIPTNDPLRNHYGLSMLFVNPSANAAAGYVIRGILSFKV